MLKIIAKHADVWTISSLNMPQLAEYRRIRKTVEEYCHSFHRNAELVRSGLGIGCVVAGNEERLREKLRMSPAASVSVSEYQPNQTRLAGLPDQCVDTLRLYSEAGVTRFVMNFPDASTLEPIRLFGERVLPAFK